MQKVIILGCPGAGKSTFARKLRDKTDLPLFYLDLLWHKKDQTNYTKAEFDSKLKKILQGDKWIIDGNYQRTIEMRLQACDTVFLLDYPVEVCLNGAESRVGHPREDLPWVEKVFDPEFKEWIINFSKEQLPEIYELLQQYQNKKRIIIFKNRNEANKFLNDYNL